MCSSGRVAFLALLLALFQATVYAQSSQCLNNKYSLVDPSQRPATRNCRIGGYLAKPALLNTTTQPDEAGCVAACKNYAAQGSPRCISFGYSSGNQTCALYSAKLINMQSRNRGQNLGTTFSNTLCFKCDTPLKCANANYDAITNGGFEIGPSDPDLPATNWTQTASDFRYQWKRIASTTNEPNNYDMQIFMYTTNKSYLDTLQQQIACIENGLEYSLSFNFRVSLAQQDTIVVTLDDQTIYSGQCGTTVPDPCFSPVEATGITWTGAAPPLLKITLSTPNYQFFEVDNVSLRLSAAATS